MLLIASIMFWDFAWWFVITGGRFAWLVAIGSVVAVLGCWKIHADYQGDTDRKWSSAVIALPLLFGSIPIVLLLPLAHVGRYSGFGVFVAIVLDGTLVGLIALAWIRDRWNNRYG